MISISLIYSLKTVIPTHFSTDCTLIKNGVKQTKGESRKFNLNANKRINLISVMFDFLPARRWYLSIMDTELDGGN